MCLGDAGLTERPSPVQEYRVLVTQVVSADASLGRFLNKVSEAYKAIARFRAVRSWDRKTDGHTVNDRRWRSSSRAIKSLSAEDNPHQSTLLRIAAH
jgi:hypothetical protein